MWRIQGNHDLGCLGRLHGRGVGGMTLTKRGRIVFGTLFAVFMISTLGLAGKLDAQDQCAKFSANNDYLSAQNAGCSFDPNSSGNYPYTWEAK